MDKYNTEPSIDAKLVLLGSSGVGKTSLVLRYVQGVYTLEQTSTIGASFMTKRMFLDDWKIKLQIWDTAGQERFRSMTPMYYRGASAAILVYDITSQETFDAVKDWVKELETNIQEDIVIAIAGNKVDLESKRQVQYEQAKKYADDIDAILFETSALSNQGIEDLFIEVARRLIAKHKELREQQRQRANKGRDKNGNNTRLDLNSPNANGKKGCCK